MKGRNINHAGDLDAHGKLRLGFTRFQLTLLVVGVMLLAVIGSTYGSQLFINNVSEPQFSATISRATVAACENVKATRQFTAHRLARERANLREQANVYQALILATEQLAGPSSPSGRALVNQLAKATESTRKLQAAISSEPRLPNCAALSEALQGQVPAS